VTFLEDCVGHQVEMVCSEAQNGSVILLENVRFHLEETGENMDENGNKVFAHQNEISRFRESLSKLGDLFVNDAFGVVQRSHSSMAGINLEIRAAGLLMEREIKFFTRLVNKPERPFTFILGGAKVMDKIKLVEKLLDSIDELIIGGGMAFTFLKIIHNMEIGNSLFDEKGEKHAAQIVKKAKEKSMKIHLPCDFVVSKSIESNCNTEMATISTGIPSSMIGVDCGPDTIDHFTTVLQNAKTIFWNGPMGVFEREPFSSGTRTLMKSVANLTKEGVITVIGGGDTVSACIKFSNTKNFSHVSTGGGASIAFLERRELPGISYLNDVSS